MNFHIAKVVELTQFRLNFKLGYLENYEVSNGFVHLMFTNGRVSYRVVNGVIYETRVENGSLVAQDYALQATPNLLDLARSLSFLI